MAAGKHKIFEEQLTPRLLQVMKGIHKQTAISNPPRVRLPITAEILKKIGSVLSKEPNNYFNKMMWAACCMAFFGFLRSSEFTVPSQHCYDPMSTCLFQISLWTEGTHQQLYVYILNSPKQTLFGKVLTFISAELTRTSAQYKQSFLIWQCGTPTQAQCLLFLMAGC